MLKNRTISSILRYCKTKQRFLDIVTKTALFQNRTNQGRVIPRPYCIFIPIDSGPYNQTFAPFYDENMKYTRGTRAPTAVIIIASSSNLVRSYIS